MTASWQDRAKQKREAIYAAIPTEWRIKEIPDIEDKRDVTGEYIQRFLSEEEVNITETDAETIVKKTTTGEWKAEEVTRAFCHRAALAHQLVWNKTRLAMLMRKDLTIALAQLFA